MLRPRPVPWRPSLVVKNGSNARCTTSAGMPTPVSVNVSRTYSPAGIWSNAGSSASSSVRFSQVIASLPPSGMASRALIARLISVFSSCPRSIITGHRFCGPDVSIRIPAPRVRRRSPVMESTISLILVAVGTRVWRLEKARRRCVRSAPVRVTSSASVTSSALSASSSVRSDSISRSIVRIARRLLKSWAIPPVSCPIASILEACKSWVSMVRRRVMSRMIPTKFRVPPSGISPTDSSIGNVVSSLRRPLTSRPIPIIFASPVVI